MASRSRVMQGSAMASSVADRLAGVHPPMLGMGPKSARFEAKADPQTSGLIVGQIIARALDYAGLEVKEAAARMGYSDPTTLYRWLAGKEAANFDRLFQLGDKFREGLALGVASACPTLRVRWTVEQAS